MQCAYCGATLTPHNNFDSRVHKAGTVQTTDHIYPTSMLLALTPAQRALLPANFAALNMVKVCSRDNFYKGHLHPLDWLVIMDSNHHAAKLAERLIKMGTPMEEVFDALRRRKR